MKPSSNSSLLITTHFDFMCAWDIIEVIKAGLPVRYIVIQRPPKAAINVTTTPLRLTKILLKNILRIEQPPQFYFKTIYYWAKRYANTIHPMFRFYRPYYWRKRKFLSEIRMLGKQIEIIETVDINDRQTYDLIARLKVDILLTIGGKILKPQIIDLALHHAINLHHGMLPQYRGLGQHYWAALNHDYDHIGTAVHKLTTRVDAGDVILQEACPTIEPTDSLEMLSLKNRIHGNKLLLKALSQLLKDHATFTPQPEPKKTNPKLTSQMLRRIQSELKQRGIPTGYAKL